jgi:hypothetical protein
MINSDDERHITLNLESLKALDMAIVNNYHDWVRNAPRDYIHDNFFQSRVPVAITSRFGQNQRLAETVQYRAEERTNWSRDRDYSRIRYITLALATHIRYFIFVNKLPFSCSLFFSARPFCKWQDVQPFEIQQLHPDGVYTSFDPDRRELISWEDLEEMEVADEADKEIPLYTEKGFLVPRRLPMYSRRVPPHGILMDLRVVKDLFETPFEQQDRHPDPDSPVDVYTYPQAGMKIAGHFQATGVMKDFNRFLQDINHDLKIIDIDEDAMEHVPAQRQKIVQAISSQGYNAVMHSTRGDSAQHHDAQLGMVTGALAGSWAKQRSTELTARRLRERCSRQLPHTCFVEKIQNENISRDFRFENVYFIDVDAMNPDEQNGE